jgi:hypothetical protein
MADFAIYTLPSDNVAPNATITIQTGTDPADENYAPEVLVDMNPARMAKILSTTGAWLFDFTNPQRIDLAAFIHGTFETTCTLKLQGNATDVWTSPSFDVEIDVLPWYGTGTRRWPKNHWLDLTEHAGYTTTGYRYWRLVCTGNSQNIWLGQVIFSRSARWTQTFDGSTSKRHASAASSMKPPTVRRRSMPAGRPSSCSKAISA